MNIAVLMGGVGFDTQKRMINGILDSALPEGTNVYIFTCDGWYYASRFKYENGEYNIYNLPDFTKYDGVITNLETIHDVKIREALIDRIRKAGVPCVSMVVRIDGMINIWMENESGIHAIVEHLVEEHHVRKIFYLSGPVESQDAGERLDAYKKASEQFRLEWDDRMVAYGDYTYKSGIQAVKEMLQKDMPLPDAVMAANDDMAVGAVLALKEAGYKVPEDILVTGYDNSSIAQLNHPRLTTVRRGEYAAAEIAYKTLMEAIRGEKPQTEHIVYGRPLFSQSCGCDKKQSYTHAELQEMYVRKSVEVDDNLELLKCCAAEFTGLETFDDFKECVQQYIRLLAPDYFYLCMCGSIENYFDELERMAEGKERERNETVYTEDIWVPLAYENGVFSSYDGFPKNELLPPSCKSGNQGDFYLVMPLHHQEYCFGYCVVGNYRPALEGRFFRHFILSLDNALETVRRQDTMNAMLGRLSKMWLYDELTGVNNRAGYNKFAPRILEEAQKKQLPIAVIFADMDGLKKVNDLYGHEEGDAYIKAMANILEHNRRHGELLARYGGDEFVIVLNGYSEDGIREYIDKIRNAIGQYNARYTRAYKLDASIGYFLEMDAEKASLELLVELADKNMYQIKREKKAAQRG
ncbi:MAG: GGDEF domain-containing protein [Lachnospiraceae bacterium]|nr:GGDEF domain-containing protein [Lachnospiraceae bacterium]